MVRYSPFLLKGP